MASNYQYAPQGIDDFSLLIGWLACSICHRSGNCY